MLRKISRIEDEHRPSDEAPQKLSDATKKRIKEKLRSIR
jgi:hypothetical protein